MEHRPLQIPDYAVAALRPKAWKGILLLILIVICLTASVIVLRMAGTTRTAARNTAISSDMSKCRDHLARLWNALSNYKERSGRSPQSLDELSEFEDIRSYSNCPCDDHAHMPPNTSYYLVRAERIPNAPDLPILVETRLNHAGKKFVLFTDGHVELLTEAEVVTLLTKISKRH